MRISLIMLLSICSIVSSLPAAENFTPDLESAVPVFQAAEQAIPDAQPVSVAPAPYAIAAFIPPLVVAFGVPSIVAWIVKGPVVRARVRAAVARTGVFHDSIGGYRAGQK